MRNPNTTIHFKTLKNGRRMVENLKQLVNGYTYQQVNGYHSWVFHTRFNNIYVHRYPGQFKVIVTPSQTS